MKSTTNSLLSRLKHRSVFVNAVLLIAAIFLVIQMSDHLDDNQWDFKTYYYAAKVAADGGDPYNVDLTRGLAGGYVHQYLYPPMALRLFRPLTYVSFETARQTWFWFRVVLLIGLVWVWRKVLAGSERMWLFYLLAIVAFNDALYLDLKAGNVTIIEQLLLWSGFFCLMNRRIACFCALVVAASLLKGMPLLFLGLLFLLSVERRWWYALGSTAAFGLIQLIDFVLNPAWYQQFLAKAFSWDERGPEFNPSLLALLKDLKGVAVKSGFPEGAGQVIVYLLFALIALSVAIVTWRSTRRWLRSSPQAQSYQSAVISAIMSITLAYPLMVPRFKIYAFMLVLPAVYLTILRHGKGLIVPLAVLVTALTIRPHFPIEQWSTDLFWWYYPTVVLVFFWIAWVKGLSRETVATN